MMGKLYAKALLWVATKSFRCAGVIWQPFSACTRSRAPECGRAARHGAVDCLLSSSYLLRCFWEISCRSFAECCQAACGRAGAMQSRPALMAQKQPRPRRPFGQCKSADCNESRCGSVKLDLLRCCQVLSCAGGRAGHAVAAHAPKRSGAAKQGGARDEAQEGAKIYEKWFNPFIPEVALELSPKIAPAGTAPAHETFLALAEMGH